MAQRLLPARTIAARAHCGAACAPRRRRILATTYPTGHAVHCLVPVRIPFMVCREEAVHASIICALPVKFFKHWFLVLVAGSSVLFVPLAGLPGSGCCLLRLFTGSRASVPFQTYARAGGSPAAAPCALGSSRAAPLPSPLRFVRLAWFVLRHTTHCRVHGSVGSCRCGAPCAGYLCRTAALLRRCIRWKEEKRKEKLRRGKPIEQAACAYAFLHGQPVAFSRGVLIMWAWRHVPLSLPALPLPSLSLAVLHSTCLFSLCLPSAWVCQRRMWTFPILSTDLACGVAAGAR